MKNIEKMHIETEATLSADIKDCIAEAIQLSITEKCPVRVLHNGHVYTVDGKKFIRSVMEGAR